MTDIDLTQASRETIQKGSSSFAAAAALFGAETRADAEMLYAWCRYCDDVIDGQELGHGMVAPGPDAAQARLTALYAQTRAALAGEPTQIPTSPPSSGSPCAATSPRPTPSSCSTVSPWTSPARRYETLEDTLDYCWHVAGVVGVMMALVMGVEPDDLATLRRAQDLGLAFQLTNISRDVIEDAANDRVYLPAAWLAEAGVPARPRSAAPEHRAAVFAVTHASWPPPSPSMPRPSPACPPSLPFRLGHRGRAGRLSPDRHHRG